MARRKKHIAYDKIAATLAAVPLIASETGLNAEHIAAGEGWLSTLVAGVIGATLAAAAALPIAERALVKGYWLKAAGLMVFFVTMLAFSFSTSVGRTGSKADGDVAAAQGHNARIDLARKALIDAEKARDAECASGLGPKCEKREGMVDKARAALLALPAEKVEDSMSKRIAAASGLSEATVALYQPLLFPLALQLGGFFFLAYGLAPRREEKPQPLPKPKSKARPATRSRSKAKAKEGDNVIPFQPPRAVNDN